MATTLAKTIIQAAATILRDLAGRRWTPSELLAWLNDGQREVGLLRPDAITVKTSLIMVAGCEQTLPEGAIRLVSITHNMGNGNQVGAPITLIDADELDKVSASWRTDAPSATVIHYTYDGRTPKTWECWPPQPGAGNYVRASVQMNPQDCTVNGVDTGLLDSVISIDDIYKSALIEYVVHRAYDKNDETRNLAAAESYYGRFLRRLGMQQQADVRNDPNKNAPPAQQSRQLGGVNQRARPNG